MTKTFLTLFFVVALLSISSAAPGKAERIESWWRQWLPVLAKVESEFDVTATSKDKYGKPLARGKYQITEENLEHAKVRHWPHWNWITVQDLYREDVSEMLALDYLNWLLNVYYKGRQHAVYKSLSAYYYGPGGTDAGGIGWWYVNKLITNDLTPQDWKVIVR